MKLDKDTQLKLLELANLSRGESLAPKAAEASEEAKALESAKAEHTSALNAAASAQMAVDDMEAEILRIQEDERKLRRREADNKKQLGAETDPVRRKDIEHDLYSSKSRIADLMSELQEAHNEIHALRNNLDVHGARVDEAKRKLELAQRAAEAVAHVEPEMPAAERIEQLRNELPETIVALFDAKRQENLVGIAEFNGRSCKGCFVVLPPAAKSAVRNAPADEMPECPECGSFLVRTN